MAWQVSGQLTEFCSCKLMCPCWLGVSAAAPPHMEKEQGQTERFLLCSREDRGLS